MATSRVSPPKEGSRVGMETAATSRRRDQQAQTPRGAAQTSSGSCPVPGEGASPALRHSALLNGGHPGSSSLAVGSAGAGAVPWLQPPPAAALPMQTDQQSHALGPTLCRGVQATTKPPGVARSEPCARGNSSSTSGPGSAEAWKPSLESRPLWQDPRALQHC